MLATALLLAVATAPPAHVATTVTALFQAQAGNSKPEIGAMTDAHVKAHPDITVSLELVPYEALRDKTVLAKGAARAYDVVLSDSVWTSK